MTLKIGYYPCIEALSPAQIIEYSMLAEKVGFDDVWISDHFHPWVHTGSGCAFPWVVLSAIGERTSRVRLGTGVTAPILRYNPAVVAQAFATLGVMYPGRVFLGLGTGEAVNEIPVGCEWPHFRRRVEMLEESIQVIKLLWSGEFVNFKGKYYRLKKANLYTKPKRLIPLYLASWGPTVAELSGRYADGHITLPSDAEHYRNVLLPAIERGAKAAGRDPKLIEMIFEIGVSYDEDYDRAVEATKIRGYGALPALFKYAIYDPREIEDYVKRLSTEAITTAGWQIATTAEDLIKRTEEHVNLGISEAHFMSVSPDEKKFLKVFGEKVIPYLQTTYGQR
jgi:coenzyme F420-dependent glucose-6-phosphate dehydrogenase